MESRNNSEFLKKEAIEKLAEIASKLELENLGGWKYLVHTFTRANLLVLKIASDPRAQVYLEEKRKEFEAKFLEAGVDRRSLLKRGVHMLAGFLTGGFTGEVVDNLIKKVLPRFRGDFFSALGATGGIILAALLPTMLRDIKRQVLVLDRFEDPTFESEVLKIEGEFTMLRHIVDAKNIEGCSIFEINQWVTQYLQNLSGVEKDMVLQDIKGKYL